MLALAVSLVVGYFVIQTTGYIVHKALHHPALGLIHETHDVHHKKMYPPEDYLNTGKYREVPNEAQPYKYYAAAAVPLVIGVFAFLPLSIAIALVTELAVVAWLNDWLHQKLHIKGYWLERYSWFHRLRELHWWHHVDDSKNFGIFSWFADRLFGTFEESQEIPSYLIEESPEEPESFVETADAIMLIPDEPQEEMTPPEELAVS
jgi:sterol desaturase/sphingolipid hydroxylase (fatty acid hydroxylase superfamily)